MHDCTKYIAIDCHFTRKKVLEGLLHLAYIHTAHHLADVFTKTLPSSVAHPLLDKLGLVDTLPSLRRDVKHTNSHNNQIVSDSVT